MRGLSGRAWRQNIVVVLVRALVDFHILTRDVVINHVIFVYITILGFELHLTASDTELALTRSFVCRLQIDYTTLEVSKVINASLVSRVPSAFLI